jgi:hypothetical protein
MCGQIFFWRRRDNVFGYIQVGFFVASIVIPVLGTTTLDDHDPGIVGLYAHLILVGGAAFLAGMIYGAPLGERSRLPSLAFARVLDPVPRIVRSRARLATIAAVLALLLSFIAIGYVPFLAADRQGAKYGVGAYRAGFERGSLIFHVALRVGSLMLPVILALVLRNRRSVDGVLAGGLALALALTLSRGSAFLGPVVVLLAWLIVKRWKPWQIAAVACLAFLSAAFVNELAQVTRPAASASFATRAAASAPEVIDQLGFLNGFELTGGEHVGLRTILAGVSLQKGEYAPSAYALRTRTGLSDISELASGGLRLPASIWGYSAFGWVGAVAWSFISGFFVGYGTTFIRRLLTPVEGRPGQLLNIVLAWVFVQGTFSVLAEFYFPERVEVIAFALVLFLTVIRRGSALEDEAAGEALSQPSGVPPR